MTPVQDLGDAGGYRPGWDRGPVDQDHRQRQVARGAQLGLGPAAPGVLRHDQGDAVLLHQRPVAGCVEWAAGNLDRAIGQGQRPLWRIDEPQQVMMLRLAREGGEVLAADRQKHPLRWTRQQGCGGRKIGNRDPAVAGTGAPGQTLERQQRDAGRSAGDHRVAADPRGEGMGGIDHPSDPAFAQKGRQAFGPAEAAGASRHRLRTGSFGASGIGQDGRQTGLGQCGGQLVGLGGAAEDEGRHG